MSLQRACLLTFLLLFQFSIGFGTGYSNHNGLATSAGLEYQRISQSYYDAILDTTKLDPIEVWQLARDNTSDLIFHSNVEYNRRTLRNHLNVNGDFEITGNRFLGRAEGYYVRGSYDRNIKLYGRYENKTPFDTIRISNDGYNYFQSYIRGVNRISSVVGLQARAGWEMVNFYPEKTYSSNDLTVHYANHDYSILSGQVGADFGLLESGRELSCLVSYYHRLVPDSSSADYDDYRVSAEFDDIGTRSILNFETEFSFKDYSQVDGKDDYGSIYATGRFSHSFNRYELSSYLKYDLHAYRKPDMGNRSYHVAILELKGLRKLGKVGVGPIAAGEVKQERAVDGISESYRQWEGGLGVSALDQVSLFCDAEATYGGRAFRNTTSSLLSSYHFISLSIMLNYSITRHISFSLLFDGNFELHHEKTDNNDLYLITAGITSRF